MSVLATNKKAFHDYTILDTFEAGIVLTGQEVKSVKSGQASLKGGFVRFKNNEAYLTNAYIPLYKKAAPDPGYNPERDRKLLLNKRELNLIAEKKNAEGLTVVPLEIFDTRGLVKVKIALARGKKKYDKREAIKKKEQERKIRKALRT